MTKGVAPVSVILEDRTRLEKGDMRNVSLFDVALYPVALAMEI